MGRSSSEESDLPHVLPNGSDMKAERKIIRKKVLKRVTLHPFTVFPISGSLGWAAFMAINGLTPWGIALTTGLFTVGGATWLWNYVTKGPEYTTEEGQKILDRYLATQEQELEDLEAACKAARFKDGVREVRTLNEIYKTVRETTIAESNPDDVRLPGFLSLIDGTYKEGVDELRRALAVHKVLATVDESELRAEIQELDEELDGLGPKQDVKRDSLERKLKAKRDKLQKYEKTAEGLQAILTRSGEIQAILEGSSFEMSDVLNVDDTLTTRGTSAANRLAIAMQAAQEARELKNLGGGLDLNEIDRRLGAGQTPEKES